MSKNIHNLQTGIKKRHELSVIKPLLKHLNINLETVNNSERPDFIIMHENRKIGLELVELAPSSKFAHKQNKNSKGPSITAISLQKIKEAKKEYEKILAARNENIAINVKFKLTAYWLRYNAKDFIKQVTKEIDDLRSSDTKKFQSFNTILSGDKVDTIYVESVTLISNKIEQPIAVSIQGQYLQPITQEDFNSGINDKLRKVADYKKLKENADIQEYWLAVAIFAKEPFEFWNAPYTLPCDIGYSRIFLIQYDGIRELNY